MKVLRVALLALTVALAAWTHGVNTGGPIMGQVKPTGTPTYVGNASFPGVIFYAFDTGTGYYSVPVPTNDTTAFAPTTWYGQPLIGSPPCIRDGVTCGQPAYNGPWDPDAALTSPQFTAFGTATRWTGASLDSQTPGAGALAGGQQTMTSGFPSGDTMRTAINLAAQPSGTTFVMFVTFMQLGNGGSSAGILAGRACNLDDFGMGNSPNSVNTFSVSGGSDNHVSFNWGAADASVASGMQSPQQITSSSAHSNNTIHTAVVQATNTTNGPGAVTTVTLYLDGTQVGQKTSQTVVDISSGNCNAEDQYQHGTEFHIFAGQSFGSFNGVVFQDGVATSAWSEPTAAASLTANPYQMLTP